MTFSSADGIQHTVPGPEPWHMYLVKYDQNGNFQWGEWNEPNPNTVGYNSVGYKVAADSSVSAYVTGWFETSSTFRSADGNDVTVTGFSGPRFFPVYPNDAFIVKYDSNGNVKWVNHIGGYKADAKDIAVSPTGEISLVGFIGNINDGTPSQAMTIVTSQPGGANVNLGGGKFTSPYNKDVVRATYNSSGVLLKATRLGGSQDEVGTGIAYDHEGNLYVEGVFQAGLTIQDHFLTGTKPYNLFVMKEAPSGWVAWVKKADGAGTNAFEERIAVESEDMVLVTGAFQNTATFGGLTLSSAGAEDVFLAELKGAPCTFNFFPLTTTLPSGTTFSMSPNGVNDFGTVVGTGFTNTTPVQNFGFVRSADGGITLVGGTISLVDRNDRKVSIGSSASGQVLVDSSGVNPLQLSFQNSGFSARGINNWGNIVGSYNTSSGANGFKRYSNGGTVKLGFPGASSTFPTSINDHGMIVGSYFVGSGGGQLPQNGFIYSQGSWATLNYPGSLFTDLVGVSNNGVIVGNATDLDLAFRYENGKFKTIVGPNGVRVTVSGISPRFGLIVGTAGPKGGFLATCQ